MSSIIEKPRAKESPPAIGAAAAAATSARPQRSRSEKRDMAMVRVVAVLVGAILGNVRQKRARREVAALEWECELRSRPWRWRVPENVTKLTPEVPTCLGSLPP